MTPRILSPVLTRPDQLGILFPWIDVNHPAEHLRIKAAAGYIARFLGRDRTVEAVLRPIRSLHVGALGGEAQIDVAMPSRDPQRHALVELILRRVLALRVPPADQPLAA